MPGVGILLADGRVAEWSMAAVLKTVVPQGTGGSNPSPSAKAFNGVVLDVVVVLRFPRRYKSRLPAVKLKSCTCQKRESKDDDVNHRG